VQPGGWQTGLLSRFENYSNVRTPIMKMTPQAMPKINSNIFPLLFLLGIFWLAFIGMK
jgi:hypothetical protein